VTMTVTTSHWSAVTVTSHRPAKAYCCGSAIAFGTN